jgi:uncharacterized protein (TIGR03067 family)
MTRHGAKGRIAALSMVLLLAGHASGQTMAPADSAVMLAQQIKSDYDALTGRWQLVAAQVDGKPVPESVLRSTVLITDHDIFRFPASAGVGTAPQGKFTINPAASPKQVDSTGEAGPNKGKVTRGIYEIIDANNKRACWGQPDGPRPTDFTSAPGSGRTCQSWRLISKAPGK